MVKLTNVTHAYGEKTVIDHLDLTLPETGVIAIMGPSGCGKTTLLRLIAGLEQPCGGTVETSYQKIAIAFQETRLINWLSAEENINFVLSDSNISLYNTNDILEKFELLTHKNALACTLSGGEKQRLSLARALCANGDLLLLDEPFAGLDEDLKARIAPIVKSANKNGLTIVVTHDKNDAALLGAEILTCNGTPLSALQKQ